MPDAPAPARARIELRPADWIDPGQWRDAPEDTRRRLLRHVADAALARKRRELLRGIGADGRKLEPVSPRSRRDGATGPPLAPHRVGSRAYRNLRSSIGMNKGTVTLWWAGRIGRYGTGTILLFHALGVVIGAYQRDVLGIAPAGIKELKAEARRLWRLIFVPTRAALVRPAAEMRVPAMPVVVPPRATVGRGGLAEGMAFARPPGAESGREYAVVLVDVRRVDASLRNDPGFYVGSLGGGAGIGGRYAEAQRFLARARAEGIKVHMPRMGMDAEGEAFIDDGRHRFAVLRDSGATAVPVVVPRGAAGAFRRKFGARAAAPPGRRPPLRPAAAPAR